MYPKRDMEIVRLKEEAVLDRTNGKRAGHNHSGDSLLWEKPEEKKEEVCLRNESMLLM